MLGALAFADIGLGALGIALGAFLATAASSLLRAIRNTTPI
jgi:hypothetical protein